MKKIAIIGANEFQNRIVLTAKRKGYETHVFAWEDGAIARQNADYFYAISITEKEKILEVLRDVKPDGICSIASDLAVPTVNYIANELKLVGNTLECTLLTTNKFEMRNALKRNNLSIPKYQLINKYQDVNFEMFDFPVIAKPIDRSGSRGIYKVNNQNELKNIIESVKQVSFSDDILIEEFIEGNEYSVECISQDGIHKMIQVTEKFTTGAPHFIEIGHLSPARISNELKSEIQKLVIKALDALKVKNGASHSEVKIDEQGKIKIIEIASRMGGDFIGSDMVLLSTGYDFVEGVLEIALNNKIDLNFSVDDKITLVKFFVNVDDVEKFKKVMKLYPMQVVDFSINELFKEVTDSSTRNGYGLINLINEKELSEILRILEI